VVAVVESSLARHYFDGVTAMLHEVARALDPKSLDRLGRRLAGFSLKMLG
jgi:hypothetical protein